MQTTTAAARWRAAAAAEMRTFVFVVAVLLLFSLFLATMGAGFGRTPFGRFVSDLDSGFRAYVFAGLAMMVVVEPVRHRGPDGGTKRILALAAAILIGGALGTACQLAWAVLVDGAETPDAVQFWGGLWYSSVVLATLLVTVGEFQRREVRSLESMRAAEEQRAALEQQALQARVRVLEAQIEPHFLFNTLANVRRLYDLDAKTGETMLTRLMSYLEVALPTLRNERSTLAREAQLIGAYLELHRVRMGRRLAYRIDIAETLQALEVPPMMLLTLVENAVKHGLAPTRDGGRVDISAAVVGNALQLAVVDTGRGFGNETSGGGTGLANIRSRLAATFGPAANLRLEPGQPHGFAATITLPLPR